METFDEPIVRYRLNVRNEITYVNDGWNQFAARNEAPELVGDAVIGRPLADFVSDESIRQMYRHLLGRVRRGHEVRFEIRCDAPARRRLLEVTVRPLAGESVEFETRPLHVEPRDPVALLDRRTPRSAEHVRLCAWCNRVWAVDAWLEIESAIQRLQLFHPPTMPRLTHAMCPPCAEKAIAAGD